VALLQEVEAVKPEKGDPMTRKIAPNIRTKRRKFQQVYKGKIFIRVTRLAPLARGE
jgi:hypothetical protein